MPVQTNLSDSEIVGVLRAAGMDETPDVPRYPFDPPQPIADGALEPWIGAATVRLQREHHLMYARRLNALLERLPQLQGVSVETLIRRVAEVPEGWREAVRDAAIGHANHQFLWKMFKPGGNGGAGPTGRLLARIEADFGSVEGMKRRFDGMCAGHLGVGWGVIVVEPTAGNLSLMVDPDNTSHMNLNKSGMLICDLWDHAYCLQYGARREEYLDAFWRVVDWDVLGKRLEGFYHGMTHM